MSGHTDSILSFKESSLIIDHLAALPVWSKQLERADEALWEEIVETE